MVPTVDLGFLEMVLCTIATAGDNPDIESTSGLSCKSINCLV